MPTSTLTVTEIIRHFSDYLNRVAYRHEAFILRRGRKAVAELRPVPSGRRLGDLPKILASLPRLSEREAESFAEDVNRSRETRQRETLRDPWAS
jgi:antitoxin (DNA-binding transcriptional repressor) of toxin-antitoxin stability system